MSDTAIDDERVVTVSTTTSAPRVQVWDVLVRRTGEWWADPYLGPSEGTMRVDPELGGLVTSHVADDDPGERHGTIRAFDPPERLDIGGILVPGAYAGSIAVALAEHELGTEIIVEQRARGRITHELEERISLGWTQLTARIAELAES